MDLPQYEIGVMEWKIIAEISKGIFKVPFTVRCVLDWKIQSLYFHVLMCISNDEELKCSKWEAINSIFFN